MNSPHKGFLPLHPGIKDSTFEAVNAAGGPLHPLPPHRKDGTLPPTSEQDGQIHRPSTCSPYLVTVREFVTHFGTSPGRLDLLEGFLNLRAAIRGHGFTRGFQWIGGSFLRAGGTPRDIDLACFVHGTIPWNPNFKTLYPDAFGKERVKELHKCDARFVDARSTTYLRWMIYWWHVYSSARPIAGDDPETHCDRRLGFVEVSMVTATDDAEAWVALVEMRQKVLGDAA
jgi:hypothetical protein